MGPVIEQYRSSKDVTFANSISGDFQNNKQMSGAVAVDFKENFGKPLIADYGYKEC